MARKKVTDQVLGDWNEVNDALKKIGDAQNEISVIESEMNSLIAEIKAEAKEKIKSILMAERKRARRDLQTERPAKT